MRFWTGDLKNYLSSTAGIEAHVLMRIAGRDQAGVKAIRAFWTGDEDREFMIGGQAQQFNGAGPSMQVQAMESRIGIEARRTRIVFSGLPDSVEADLSDMDLHAAPVVIWLIVMDGGRIVGQPEAVLEGWCDGASVHTGAVGEPSSVEITVADAAMPIMLTLDRLWSDASQIARGAGYSVSTPATENSYTLAQTIQLPAGTTSVEIITIGGGGGGANSYGHEGSAGERTIARLNDSSGNTKMEVHAIGGAGGVGKTTENVASSYLCHPLPSDTGDHPPHGSGGAGGSRYIPPTGGSDDAVGTCWRGHGGTAGDAVTGISTIEPGDVIEIVAIGQGGAGAAPYAGHAAGSPGSPGAVIVKTSQAADDRFMKYAATAGEIEIEWAP